MTTNAQCIDDAIVQRLSVLEQEFPQLKDAAQLYKAVLPLLCKSDLHIYPVSLTHEEVRRKMQMGLPLLHDLALGFDEEALRELLLQLARALEIAYENNGALMRTADALRIRLALDENKLSVGELLSHTVADTGEIENAAKLLQLNSALVCALVQNAIKPAFRAWCKQLMPLAEGILWDKGYCFLCGSNAMLGELRGDAQAKHLRCGQCGADWPFRRLQCTYCGNEDYNTLFYLYSENENERARAEVCDKCRGYLKVIASFSPTQPEMLPVEDLATLHFDYIAEAKGYARIDILEPDVLS